MIENRQFRLNKFDVIGAGSIAEVIERSVGRDALRWYIAQITDDEIVVEATYYDGEIFESSEGVEGRRHLPGRNVVVSIVPTGVGCNLGGYAGDAAPATNLLAATTDYLVTNPNAVNASNFISMDENVLYTEGLCIDLFMKGRVDLHVPYANRVGLVVEKSSSAHLDVVFNIVNTVRAVHGIDIADVVITEQAIGSHCVENATGAFVGTVDRPEVLFDACEQLLRKGANAIAITTNIQDLPPEEYVKHFEGEYPNPLGGVEAIISHMVVNRFQVPAAHAPMLNLKELELLHTIVDARGAGEMASVSGLACTLIGLRRAPQIDPKRGFRCADMVNVHNLLAVVSPADCLGGIPAIYAHKYGIPIVAVAENSTILGVRGPEVGIDDAIEVRSYAEAAGVLLALKRGINLESIRRPLPTLRHRFGKGSMAERRLRTQRA
ncbi:MAG TPA: DUF3326 domain-containing protein [Thermoanaerobaculia bacterium]|nr:DUF3326 domain-containing protein [Thermoanaerobaculia bacterium]